MLAVILAAGRGTRMGALTEHTPKPLLPLQGRPIIEHILIGLRAAGIDEAIVVTGYRGAQIEAHLGERRLGQLREGGSERWKSSSSQRACVSSPRVRSTTDTLPLTGDRRAAHARG
jgi:NDP-sugar pyrophosphorylase family protein